MSTNRDTQFSGFAKALWSELEANIDFIPEGKKKRATFLPKVEGIIARRAFDLASHIATQTILVAHGDMAKIPDMTELPELTKEEEKQMAKEQQ